MKSISEILKQGEYDIQRYVILPSLTIYLGWLSIQQPAIANNLTEFNPDSNTYQECITSIQAQGNTTNNTFSSSRFLPELPMNRVQVINEDGLILCVNKEFLIFDSPIFFYIIDTIKSKQELHSSGGFGIDIKAMKNGSIPIHWFKDIVVRPSETMFKSLHIKIEDKTGKYRTTETSFAIKDRHRLPTHIEFPHSKLIQTIEENGYFPITITISVNNGVPVRISY